MHRFTVVLSILSTLAGPASAAPQSAADLKTDLATLVKGDNEFSLNLLARVREEGRTGNLFCSPYSIATALAMIQGGARGETADQIARVLHCPLDTKRLHPARAELIRELNGHGLPRDYQLNIANALWVRNRITFRADYKQLLRTHYGARIGLVDFRNQSEAARERINRWVEERTNNKIKNLLGKDDVDPLTTLVLINAISFRAAWQRPFETSATKDASFTTAAGKAVKVAMMHQTAEFRYRDGGSFQALELPYEGHELAMVVFLPREKSSLARFEGSLTASKLAESFAALKPTDVAVALPRFKFASRRELSRVLAALGMPLAFSSDADFCGITSQEKLHLSRVIHQAFVDVNEKETEAVAATAGVWLSLGAPPPPPIVFRADRPFLFLVRDTRTGAILFLGRVTDPTATTAE